MRTTFPGEFRPTSDELSAIWKRCIFVIDANVLLNLYRYSPETREELEKALKSVGTQLFAPHQAAKEYLKNRLGVTAGQAEEYAKAIQKIKDLSATLSNKKKHPYLPDAELPNYQTNVEVVIAQLEKQRQSLLERLTKDEILEFVSDVFKGKTGAPFSDSELKTIVEEGEVRYAADVPPGYKDGKKDASGDPYRKFGDLIVWRQLINKAKSDTKDVIFVTDDKKEDWWLDQLGRTIGPRTELREEFISQTKQEFWMYTVDKFIEEAARTTHTQVNQQVIEEIREVSQEIRSRRFADEEPSYPYRFITKDEMLQKIAASERWAADHNDGFIGLKSYVSHYLGNAGYDFSSSYDMIRKLEDEGHIEVYEHHGEGHERPVRAIRLKRSGYFVNRPLENLGDLIHTNKDGA